METGILVFAILAGLACYIFIRFFIEYIAADPKHIGLLTIFGQRAVRRYENGRMVETLLPPTPFRSRFLGLPLEWVGWTPGRVLDYGYYIIIPLIQKIIKVQATVFDLDLEPIELTTKDEITAPFQFSMDYSVDPLRINAFIDRRVDGQNEREKNAVIEQKLIDAFSQSVRAIIKGLTFEEANSLDDRQFNKLMMRELCGLSDAQFEQLWPAGQTKAEDFRKIGVPDALGLGILVHLVTFEKVPVPAYVQESFAQVTKRTFKLRASITEILIRYTQSNPAFANFLLKEGFLSLIAGKEALEADDLTRILEAMAKNNIAIPEKIQKYWEELDIITKGHGKILKIRGSKGALPLINIKEE